MLLKFTILGGRVSVPATSNKARAVATMVCALPETQFTTASMPASASRRLSASVASSRTRAGWGCSCPAGAGADVGVGAAGTAGACRTGAAPGGTARRLAATGTAQALAASASTTRVPMNPEAPSTRMRAVTSAFRRAARRAA